MPSSGMCPRVGLVRTDVSAEYASSIFIVERIRDLGTTFAVTGIQPTKAHRKRRHKTASSIEYRHEMKMC
jgi:hypothetical protein